MMVVSTGMQVTDESESLAEARSAEGSSMSALRYRMWLDRIFSLCLETCLGIVIDSSPD